MSTYECRESRLIKNYAHSVLEYDECGNVVGAYRGYWNPGTRSMTLYPDWRHPAVKPGAKLVKKKIYDGYVKCIMRNSEGGIKDARSAPVKSQTSRAMKDIVGQEKMKF